MTVGLVYRAKDRERSGLGAEERTGRDLKPRTVEFDPELVAVTAGMQSWRAVKR